MFIHSAATFADFVRSRRVMSGKTQEDLARETGMSRRWVQEVESGNIIPSLEGTLRLCAAFDFELHLEPSESSSPLDTLLDELT